MKIKRMYHHFNKWEEYKNNMYEENYNIDKLDKCIELLGNETLCKNAMMRVVNEWEYTLEDNLTNTGLNRKSWLGQAACNIEFGVSEDVTRKAWFKISTEQQDTANQIAGEVIDYYINEILCQKYECE